MRKSGCLFFSERWRSERSSAARSGIASVSRWSSGDRSWACCHLHSLLPHVDLFWTTVLTVPIGLILASAFSAIMVYAQELLPSRVGMVAGLFFGFAFGMGGVGGAALGWLADRTSIGYVYQVCGNSCQ